MGVVLAIVSAFMAFMCVVVAFYEVRDERKFPLKMCIYFVVSACAFVVFIS